MLDWHATLNEPNISHDNMDAFDAINPKTFNLHEVQYKNIRVGDIVIIKKGKISLSTSSSSTVRRIRLYRKLR